MLRDDIQKTVNKNLKAGNAMEVKVLRFILSEIKYAEINKKSDLTDEEVIKLLQKEMKKRKEAIEMFKKGGRNDLVNDEEKQLIIINSYIPEQKSSEDLEKIIDEIIASSSDKSNVGRIIGMVMAKTKGEADGALVASMVKKKLIPV